MTTFIFLPLRNGLMGLLALAALSSMGSAQEATPLEAPKSTASVTTTAPDPEQHKFRKFNLDFPGGTPAQLIEAINQASGRPVNAIIPVDLANTPLPALKMKEVDVPHLFVALTMAFERQERSGGYVGTTKTGFMTQDKSSDNAIWYFFQTRPPEPPTVCRFYSLSPFLDKGLTVDDITTAIQTGWKMMRSEKEATMSFHKETKLLIVVGDSYQLDVVEGALRALQPKPVPFNPTIPVAPTEKK